MIARMERIEIIFLQSELSPVIARLQDQGVVHLEDVPLAVESYPGFLHRVHLPERERNELEGLEEFLRLLKESVPLIRIKPGPLAVEEAGAKITGTTFEDWSGDAFRHQLRAWHRDLRSLNRRRLNIEDNIEVLQNYRHVLNTISPLLAQRNAVLGKNARAMILEGYTPEMLDALQKRFITEVGPETEFIHRVMNRGSVIAVVVHPQSRGAEIARILKEAGIAPLDAPEKNITGETPQQVLQKIDNRVSELQADRDEILTRLQVYSQEHGAQMLAYERLFSNRLAQLRVVERFAQSKMVGVVHGWVPAEQYEALRGSLAKEFGARVAIDKLPMGEVDIHRIPTLRRNHPIFKPFEQIMALMKPPTYGSFDPTALVAVAFILFYGFIVGDIAYGLIIFGIGWLVKQKWGYIKVLNDGMTIFQWMGASTCLFGIIYMEFFGDVIEHFTPLRPIFPRAEDTSKLLYIAIFMGVIHIPLALILGIREAYNHGHNKHAEERLAMLLGLSALAAALMAGSGFFPLGASIGYLIALVVFCIALFFFVRSMKWMFIMGMLEIISLCANVLSYARLMALGVAGIAFAQIANNIAHGTGGFMLVLVGIPAALLVHAFNLGISVFSPTIHSLRLNFVEFLPKFYESEGRNYEPFRKEMAW